MCVYFYKKKSSVCAETKLADWYKWYMTKGYNIDNIKLVMNYSMY